MKRVPAWPVGIVVVLLLFAAGNIQMMRLASADPSFAVEPDYYRKAVAFDSTMAQQRRNADLGWIVTAAIDRETIPATVSVRLADGTGQPVRDAKVRIDARFNARANDVLTADLTETAPGTYTGRLGVKFAGEWEVRVDAVRAADHFTASARTQAPLQ